MNHIKIRYKFVFFHVVRNQVQAIYCAHYSKTYPGGKRAVDDLTLHVRPGEIYGFIGHNGAGKTTTLRAVAGVMDFTEGTITIDGHDIKKIGDFGDKCVYKQFIGQVYKLCQNKI